jgi:hypothetical protein
VLYALHLDLTAACESVFREPTSVEFDAFLLYLWGSVLLAQ